MSDRKFTSSYRIFLCENLVSWTSKKQSVGAQSSAEAEFRVMVRDYFELLWMKIVLDDLKLKCEGPMKLSCDNKSTINIVHNFAQRVATRHIKIDQLFIQEKFDSDNYQCLKSRESTQNRWRTENS